MKTPLLNMFGVLLHRYGSRTGERSGANRKKLDHKLTHIVGVETRT